jgi:TolA-binding protein
MTYRSARHLSAALVLFVLVASPGQPARAQVESREGIALQNQILDLRRQMQSLQDQSGRGGGSPTYLGRGGYPPPPSGSSDLVAQLLTRVDALEEQVRQLRGRVDQTQNEVQRQGAELGKRMEDMAFQTQNPQGSALGGPSPGPRPTPMQAAPPSPQPPGNPALLPPSTSLGGPPQGPIRRTPELAIQEGNAALARRDYLAAEQAAREVLSGNRTSPRAYDAQFLLAQALMGQRQYSQAAIAYDAAYNRSRVGLHAPEALLGLANSLIGINEKKAACDTLSKLRAEYPSPRPDIREAMSGSAQRAGCR